MGCVRDAVFRIGLSGKRMIMYMWRLQPASDRLFHAEIPLVDHTGCDERGKDLNFVPAE